MPPLAHNKAIRHEFKGLASLWVVALVFTYYMSLITPAIMKKYKHIFHTLEERCMELVENTYNEMRLYAAYLCE